MRLFKFFVWALAVVAMAGCSTPLTHVSNQVFNFGQELPPEMVGSNLSAYVAFDEAYAGDYNHSTRNVLYGQGVAPGSAEYRLRVVRISTVHLKGNLIWSDGQYLFPTAAVVPDHLERLQAGDLVEFRLSGSWRTLENFTSRKEGNVVLRVLCKKRAPDYDDCVANRAPKTGKYAGHGKTRTAYPASLAHYGFEFSTAYTADGKPAHPRLTASR